MAHDWEDSARTVILGGAGGGGAERKGCPALVQLQIASSRHSVDRANQIIRDTMTGEHLPAGVFLML